MNTYPATLFGLPDTAPDLARRFAAIMAGLAALIARRFLKMPHLSGFTLLLWGRLSRAVRRFHRALTGPVTLPAARAARPARTRVQGLALPAGRGWIVRELGWEAAGYMVQLEALLREAASRATLRDAPGAGRVLRPICRMLGVPTDAIPQHVAKAAAVLPPVCFDIDPISAGAADAGVERAARKISSG